MERLKKEIERLAYEIYEQSGYQHGCHLEHWLQAEQVILAKQVLKPAGLKQMEKELAKPKAAPRVKAEKKAAAKPAGEGKIEKQAAAKTAPRKTVRKVAPKKPAAGEKHPPLS